MRKYWLQTVLGVLFALSAPAIVSASTIVVAKGGSGDYEVIQDAVYAAAEGDTIYIRAGEYAEHAPYTDAWGYTWDAYVSVNKTDLVILGEDRDSVIIGPETPAFDGFDPKGFLGDESIDLTVKTLTIRNVRDGFNVPFGCTVEGVAIEGCYTGIGVRALGGALIRNCSFKNMTYGVFVSPGSQSPRIESCSFGGTESAIVVVGGDDVVVADCTVLDAVVAIHYQQFAAGAVRSTRIGGAVTYAIAASDGVDLVVEATTIGPTQVSVYASNDAHVVMNGCAVGLGSLNTIWLSGESTAEITGCDLGVAGAKSIWMRPGGYISDPPKIIDMRNNYWGVADSASIADMIWDMSDDPEIKGIVEFMPFSTTPLPTERRSMGSFKALFGGP